MGSYAVTKVVMKVKPEFVKPLRHFLDVEQTLPDWFDYSSFWESLGLRSDDTPGVMFSHGHFHAYTTALGCSDSRNGSYFYNNKNQPRLEEDFWFVEFGSKLRGNEPFI